MHQYATLRRCLVLKFLSASIFVLALLLICPAGADPARTGPYTEALIQVTFSDESDSAHAYSVDTLQQAGYELGTFFDALSYGKLKLNVVTARVKLGNTRDYYYGHCNADTSASPHDRCFELTRDVVAAVKAIDASHASFFDTVDGVTTLWIGSTQDFAMPPFDSILSGTLEVSFAGEGTLLPPPGYGPKYLSLVPWQGWAHEIGHQLQYDAHLNVSGKYNGHPSGYNSGYDLMDSCYHCDQSAYGKVGTPFANDNRGAFGGWLDSSHVAVVPTATAPSSHTFTLAPISTTIQNPVVQAVQVVVDSKRSYFINTRQRTEDDLLQGYTPRGIFDAGVQIHFVDENSDPPMTVCAVNTAGCSGDPWPGGTPSPLWHPGQSFNDSANGISIRIDAAVTNGYTITIDQNVPTGHPDLYITRWLTPPENTYDTTDIWVDSSCNGYEDQSFPLKYGRRADGTVVQGGDDPCANHENRIYAQVHNSGSIASQPSNVLFEVTAPLGVGVSGNWSIVGTVPLPTIPAGGSATVFIPWTPAVALDPSQIASEHFNFHTCIRVTVQPSAAEIAAGDTFTSDKQAQENKDVFEAVSPIVRTPHYQPLSREIAIQNTQEPRGNLQTYVLKTQAALPPGWRYSVNNGVDHLTLKPGERRLLPVSVIPGASPVGRIYTFQTEAYTSRWLTNVALPPNDPRNRHPSFGSVGGVALSVHTVYQTKIDLSARPLGWAPGIIAQGVISPPRPNVSVAIDYGDPQGKVTSRIVLTDANGRFQDLWREAHPGRWQVSALWQGDMTYASAVSPFRVVNYRP